ncbi:MAG TPA: hypothetical protein VGC87_12585 [Pyrinomonadaceae bacterium]|jgi:hypothetical protein
MAKLIVDRIKCISSTESSDDLYFLVMRFDHNCNVHRVGPNSAWAAMKNGDVRNADVVLVNNFSGEYLVAVIEEDDSFDFDQELNVRMSKGLRLLYKVTSVFEKDRGRRLAMMLFYFANMIGKERTNDDLLSVEIVNSKTEITVLGQGSHYQITLNLV